MTRIGRWLTAVGLFAASGVIGVTAARAIDASGQWFLQSSFFPGLVIFETWTQTGSVLTTDDGWTGTIDPSTGAFSMSTPSDPICGPCPTCCIVCPDDTRTGTVAPDALTFTATESDPVGTMCHPFEAPLTGSRYECGNGIVDPTEQCDDGNYTAGDGCDPFCHIETCYVCSGQPSTCSPAPSGSPCDDGDPCTTSACNGSGACAVTGSTNCDDGNPCTVDSCNAMGCTHAPDVRSCRSAGQSVLLLETSASASKDKLTWKWIKGQSTSELDFSDPRNTATYTFCLFAGTSAAVVGRAAIPPDAMKWLPIDGTGFIYKDATGSVDGIRSVVLKSSSAQRAKIVLKGKGANLPTHLPGVLPLPVTAQLVNDANGVCFQADYSTAIKNDGTEFKAIAH